MIYLPKKTFEEPEDFIPQLFHWATRQDNETLSAYSMGLLGSALEVQENASKYRNENAVLMPIAFSLLNKLKVP